MFIMVVFAIQFCWKDFYHAYRWMRIKRFLLKYPTSVIVEVRIWYHKAFLIEYDGTMHEVSGKTHSLNDVKAILTKIKCTYFLNV